MIAVDTAMEREIVRAAVVMGCSIRYMLQEHAEGVEQARDRTHGSSCTRACVHMYTHARFRCLAVSDETLYLTCIFVVVVMDRVTPSF